MLRWADGKTERLPALAAELVRLNVDLICTAGSQASAKAATPKIPVVFANVAFPPAAPGWRAQAIASARTPQPQRPREESKAKTLTR